LNNKITEIFRAKAQSHEKITTMSKLKTAVIGVGYPGKFHADKYAAHEDCDLIAVVDANASS